MLCADVVPERDGSCFHLLGVTPDAMKAKYLPGRKAAQVRIPSLHSKGSAVAFAAQAVIKPARWDNRWGVSGHVFYSKRLYSTLTKLPWGSG